MYTNDCTTELPQDIAAQLRSEGFCYIRPGRDIGIDDDTFFVYRPAPAFPGMFGQRVIFKTYTTGQWRTTEPTILCYDGLPVGVRAL